MSKTDSIDGRPRLRFAASGVAVFGIAALFFVSLVVSKPAMPDRVVLLTGPEHSAYHDLGIRYAADLRRRGLEVEVVATDGALDNVRQIAEGRKAVAFAPSAVGWERDAGVDVSSVVGLGSVGFEPLWLFHRSSLSVSLVSDLANRTVVTEGLGTSSHHVAEVLIEENDLTGRVQLQSIDKNKDLDELIELLVSEKIDAIFLTGDPGCDRVKTLLHADGVQFFSFDRAEANETH